MEGAATLRYSPCVLWQSCKRDSVPVPEAGPLPFIWAGHHCPALAAYPPGSDGQPSIPGIFGLATRKVYPVPVSPPLPVGSYPTFSPLPRPLQAGAVIFCGTCCLPPHGGSLPVRKYGALRCPDFPPRHKLPERQSGLPECKDTKSWLIKLQ